MTKYPIFFVLILPCCILFPFEVIHATNSPFGVTLPENTPLTDGIFGSFFAWVAVLQSSFYQALTESVDRLKQDGTATWLFIFLSFGYGVFHAVGPGHGKAVISTYVLANGHTLRRGILIAMFSAMVQALVAIALISVTAVVLNLTSIAITQTTKMFEIGSFALIVGLGAWLLWLKALKPSVLYMRNKLRSQNGMLRDNEVETQLGTNSSSECGHVHFPNPDLLNTDNGYSALWPVIAAVGLRPCSGALIVLVFAMSQGLVWAGIVSTLAMGVGTGLTVAVLASLAVGARELTLQVVGSNSLSFVHRSIEIAGAGLIFLIGLTLLIASVGWGI